MYTIIIHTENGQHLHVHCTCIWSDWVLQAVNTHCLPHACVNGNVDAGYSDCSIIYCSM